MCRETVRDEGGSADGAHDSETVGLARVVHRQISQNTNDKATTVCSQHRYHVHRGVDLLHACMRSPAKARLASVGKPSPVLIPGKWGSRRRLEQANALAAATDAEREARQQLTNTLEQLEDHHGLEHAVAAGPVATRVSAVARRHRRAEGRGGPRPPHIPQRSRAAARRACAAHTARV